MQVVDGGDRVEHDLDVRGETCQKSVAHLGARHLLGRGLVQVRLLSHAGRDAANKCSTEQGRLPWGSDG